jgi:P27 family predicted phage terminase small subunit
MTSGPAPKPTAIKRLEGNPGKRPLNEHEPEPTRGCTPPAWLPTGALAEWDRVYPELDALGLATVVDQAALACWCVAVDMLERATLRLIPTKKNPTPEVQVTDKGYECVSGVELMRRQAMKDIRAFCQEFGFSPASRSRISVEKSETSKLDALMGGNDPN